MKRYKLTRISIKTREIVSLSSESANETSLAVCPICHSALPASLPAAASSAAAASNEKRPAELPPAKNKQD